MTGEMYNQIYKEREKEKENKQDLLKMKQQNYKKKKLEILGQIFKGLPL